MELPTNKVHFLRILMTKQAQRVSVSILFQYRYNLQSPFMNQDVWAKERVQKEKEVRSLRPWFLGEERKDTFSLFYQAPEKERKR